MLTERQQQILESAIAEHIRLALPVSSQLLEERYDFEVSPATIRNEMLVLSEKGYLAQPHTSSGRIPTDKGYRFLVDNLLLAEHEGALPKLHARTPQSSLRDHDPVVFLQEVTRELSLASSLFATVVWGDLFWKEGWEILFSQPEVEEKSSMKSFIQFLQDVEENMEEFPTETTLHISIGKENRFSKVKDFSIMVTECSVPENESMKIALLGPKRMAYDKNIQLLESVLDSFTFHGKEKNN